MGKVKEVLQEETTRQTVILIFGIAGAIATVTISRMAMEPDQWRTVKMAVAKTVYRHCRKGALTLMDIAAKADEIYERNRA